MRWGWAALAGIMAASTGANANAAHPVRAVYGGLLYHDVPLLSDDSGGIEDAPNIQAEVQFESPKVFRYIGNPSVYVVGSLNLRGDTSFGGFGLNWRFKFLEKWAVEPGLGYAIHTGEIDNPFPSGTPESERFDEENILFGSRDQFRLSLGITRELGEKWAVQAYYEHLSHGQILGDGRNQAIDNLGLRAAYKFARREKS